MAQPQMVEGHDVDKDGLVRTLKLRCETSLAMNGRQQHHCRHVVRNIASHAPPYDHRPIAQCPVSYQWQIRRPGWHRCIESHAGGFARSR
jgi:hypothetical protein